MTDKINASIALILRGNMKRLRLQLEAGEEWDGTDAHRILVELELEAGALSDAIGPYLIRPPVTKGAA